MRQLTPSDISGTSEMGLESKDEIAVTQQVTEVTTCSINFVVQSIETNLSVSGVANDGNNIEAMERGKRTRYCGIRRDAGGDPRDRCGHGPTRRIECQ